MHEPTTSTTEAPQFTWSISLSFWLTLLLAFAIYASVALSPKMLGWLTIRGDFVANQVQLVRLEEQVHYLESVAQALETDPDFAAEVARAEFNAYRAGDERIPVAQSLSLGSRTSPASVKRPDVVLPWYAPIFERLATSSRLRSVLLVISAGLLLFAFTFLNEEAKPQLKSGKATAVRIKNGVKSRYVEPVADDDDWDEDDVEQTAA